MGLARAKKTKRLGTIGGEAVNTGNTDHRAILQRIAQRAMVDGGLLPDFSAEAVTELTAIQAPATADTGSIRDLRGLLWASIDNDDSLDLDQLTVAEAMPGGPVKVMVAVADVDALVKDGSAIDEHARHNTTTVYTAAEIFPMLPEKLSTNLTSLNFQEDRLAVVAEMVVGPDGSVQNSDIYRAQVRNRAKLAYNSVAAWLTGDAGAPPALAAVSGLDQNLRLQDKVAQNMKNLRHVHGALSLETVEATPVFDGDQLKDLAVQRKNRAQELIEDLMIAANGVTTRYLAAKQYPSLRRVVRTPKRWDRIVQIASEHGFALPADPDSKALDAFLSKQQAADPTSFPDLSLAIIKLIGSGEYVAELPGQTAPGHFGLAVSDYTHSTAPNRRYPDVITQRLLKAAIAGSKTPYGGDQLVALAAHCTEEEDVVKKVERQVGKSAAALVLQSRIGQQFDAIATGAGPKGTWVRLLSMPVEGKLVQGFNGVDVGHQFRVRLISVDVEKGFIDFARA
jgi:VacB/RNase II family 3'-5' exoribonuclease